MKMAHGDRARLVVLIEGSRSNLKISRKDEMLELKEKMVESALVMGSPVLLRTKSESTSGDGGDQELCASKLIRERCREDVFRRKT